MKYLLLLATLMAPSAALAERLTGINVQMSPFVGTGELSNHARVKSHLGIKVSLDKLFPIGEGVYLGPRMEAGNSYLTTKSQDSRNKVLSTYDTRFITAGFRSGLWVGDDIHPSDIYLAAGFGRGFSKLVIDESGDNYYAQRKVNQIEGNYRAVEVGGNWHVRRGFSFNGSVFSHIYNANQGDARQSADSEVATTKGIELTSGEELDEIDARVTQKTYGLALGFTLGF